MLHIVDLRKHTCGKKDFAVWDTVNDRFVEDESGDQSWNGLAEFKEAKLNEHYADCYVRIINLLPEWAR